MILISVVIPVYNGEATIRATIASVLDQSFRDFELIVIDDGSTDNTVEIVKAIADPRISVFSYANAGQAESRNRGAKLASGEFLSFIDADDLWTPDKLDAQLQALKDRPDAAVAYSWTAHVDEGDRFFRHGPRLSFEGNVYEKLIINDFVGSGSNVLVRKSAFFDVGGFETSFPPAEDWELWVRLAAKYRFVVVPKAQILYRTLTRSASFNVAKMEASSLKVIDRIFQDAPESLKQFEPLCLGHRYKYLTYKALDLTPERKRARSAFRFLALALYFDRDLWRRRVVWKVLLRTTATLLFPEPWMRRLVEQYPKPFDIEALLIHMRFPDDVR
ncbi:Beta-13-glucosyltransferase [Geitlerinema sp. FC II]|nr:glycosyltransferase [Geitlerinema sp. CS-897]PPT08386.1 Beta-13-glucosyltransferase [Geitlerinema sp. FC II]